ncbi:hypothetical protein ACFX2C_009267 [Malus domestica]
MHEDVNCEILCSLVELNLSNTCDRSFTSPGTDARLQIENIPDFSVMWCKLGQILQRPRLHKNKQSSSSDSQRDNADEN